MEFLKIADSFFTSIIVLAGVIIIASMPTIIRRVRLGMKKEPFSCIMCGNCCRFATIQLTKKDIERIKGEGHTGFVDKGRLGERKLAHVKGRCVFSRDDKCSIYSIRPEVCRKFPFIKIYGFIPYIHEWSCCPAITTFKEDVL